MGFRYGTKDYYERETEEAERLVRPSPKVKPKRTDLRREETRPDRDPDIDDDKDTKKDPDLSLNYKSVGGSTGARVLARFLQADLDRSSQERNDRVKVRHRETGNITYVKPETLKEESAKYEAVDDTKEEQPKPEAPKPEVSPESPKSESKQPEGDAKEKASIDYLRGIRNRSRKDPEFGATMTAILPGGELEDDPDNTPMLHYPELWKFGPFRQFKTIGEVRKSITSVATKGIVEKILDLEEQEEQAPPKKPEEEKPEQQKSEEKPQEAPPPAQPEAPTAPEEKPPVPPQPETAPPQPEQAPPVEEKSPEQPKPPVPQQIPTEEGKPAQPPPEAPKGKLHPDDQKEFDAWINAKGFEDEKFKQWAAEQPGAREKDGKIFFRDDERGKMIPFDQLSDSARIQWKKRFDAESTVRGAVDALKETVKKSPSIQRILKDLANPQSALMKSLAKDKAALKKDPRKALRGLSHVDLPDSINTVQDLIDASSTLYKQPPPPERREVSQGELDRAKMHIIENFPPDMAKNLLDQNLHPDDVSELMASYHLAKDANPKSIEEALEMVGGSYEINPANVSRPPRFGKNDVGEEVPFEDLTPEEQGEAMQKHRMRTVAISLAAREGLVERLHSKTKAPEELLGRVADFALARPQNETPEQRIQRAQSVAKDLFHQTLANGLAYSDTRDLSRWESQRDEASHANAQRAREMGVEYDADADPDLPPVPKREQVELSNRQVDRLFDVLKSDPGAQQIAVGFLQAADYLDARQRFLGDSPDTMSEHQSPRQIWRGLQKAMDYFEDQADRYPPELRWSNHPGTDFRHRILDKVRTLAPEKYPFLAKWNEEFEDEEYKRRLKEWENTFSEKGPYRNQGLSPPPKPNPPPGYDLRHGDKKQRKTQRERMFDEHRRQLGLDEDVSDRVVQASIVAARFLKFSSYPLGVTMASVDGKTKKAVYWGVEPYPKGHEGFAPYTKWTQVHQRDLTSTDYNAILTAARGWLRAPVLSQNIDGIVKDTQLRAALDLALRTHEDGRYSAGVHPQEYNKLLARLAGESQTETLLTVQAAVRIACGCAPQNANDSVYAPPGGEEPPMKASATIRAFAARAASTNPTLAYELVELAGKVAEQEQQDAVQDQKQSGQVPPQFLEHMKKKEDGGEEKKDEAEGQQKQAYAALKSVVIKMAHANPHLREAYLPILQTIKQLG